MNWIIYDLEATCWMTTPPNTINEIIEVGAYKLDRYGSIIGSFNKFVKPAINPLLSAYCQELCHIEQEWIDQAKAWNVVSEEFQDWMGLIDDEECIMAAWGGGDQELLETNCELLDLEIDWIPFHVDVKEQYNRWRGNDKKWGFKESVQKDGFEFEGTQHRAIDDALNLVKIFKNHLDIWQF